MDREAARSQPEAARWKNGAPTSPPKCCRELASSPDRIEQGLKELADPNVLEAFRLANKVMAAVGRQRRKDATDPPKWRPFQLAFLLLNLTSIAEPENADRELVDLLFFPTGGGKTEAYLGLAAFTMFLRRLRNPGSLRGCGVAVIMRYTLRLLTLDQLGRGAALICAMELERRNDVEKLGKWPFEIGLWVGQAATPNHMGKSGERDENTARARTRKFKQDQKTSPIPARNVPVVRNEVFAQLLQSRSERKGASRSAHHLRQSGLRILRRHAVADCCSR